MDGECAFCGRGDGAARQLYCDDCQAEHKVCANCADEVATESERFRLVA
jgi:hypothetical protein